MGNIFNAEFVDTILTFIAAVATSSGIWAYVMKRNEIKDLSRRLLLGLAHDRIIFLGMSYIERGWITRDEYENLCDYLYTPYSEMGGNGTAKKIMDEVGRLPTRKNKYLEPETQPFKILSNGENNE